MRSSIILSTYNQPDWLRKVIYGYSAQTYCDFELIIADDGSGPETKACIDEMRSLCSFPMKHVWQEDDGFQKTRILNKALREVETDYVVFSDGDCVPRWDFLEAHMRLARPGHYLSGGYCKLPMRTSHAIEPQHIASREAFRPRWMARNGHARALVSLKLNARGSVARFLNRASRTRTTWNGHNASGWYADILAVNGFDERMQYGGEDWEMGLRLVNRDLQGIRIRYSAICVHLDHPRGYVTAESHAKNERIGLETIASGTDWTRYGIAKGDRSAASPSV